MIQNVSINIQERLIYGPKLCLNQEQLIFLDLGHNKGLCTERVMRLDAFEQESNLGYVTVLKP